METFDQLAFLNFILQPLSFQKNYYLSKLITWYFSHQVNNVFNAEIRDLVSGFNFFSFNCCYRGTRLFTGVYCSDDDRQRLVEKLSELHYYTPNFFYQYFSYDCNRDVCLLNISKEQRRIHIQELISPTPIDNKLTTRQLQELQLQGISAIRLAASQGISLTGKLNKFFICQILPEPVAVPIYSGAQLSCLYTTTLLRINGYQHRAVTGTNPEQYFLEQFPVTVPKAELPLSRYSNWNFVDPRYNPRLFNQKIILPYPPVYLNDLGNHLTLLCDNDICRLWLEREFSEGLQIEGYPSIKERLLGITPLSLDKLFSLPESWETQLLISLVINGIKGLPLMDRIASSFKTLANGNYGKVTLLQHHNRDLFAFKVPLVKKGEIYHENVVGQILNQLRKYLPNFMYVYGIISDPVSWCDNDTCDGVLAIENIPAISLKEFLQRATGEEYVFLILQVLNSLYLAYRYYQFNHNDFHGGNLLIQPLKQPVEIDIYDENLKIIGKIVTSYLARIIDYGQAAISYQGVTFTGNSNRTVTPLVDIFPFFYYLNHYVPIRLTKKCFYLLTAMKLDDYVSRFQDLEGTYSDDNIEIEENGMVNRYRPFQDFDTVIKNYGTCQQYLINKISYSYNWWPGNYRRKATRRKDQRYYLDLLYNHTPEEREAEDLIRNVGTTKSYFRSCRVMKRKLLKNLSASDDGAYNRIWLSNRLDQIIRSEL